MLIEGISREEIAAYPAMMTAFGGVPWQVILAGYHENLVRTGRKPCTMTVESAVSEYLAAMKKRRDNKAPDGTPERTCTPDVGE